MINDYDVDPDGFNAEIQDNKDMIALQNLSYEKLLDFAARTMTERDYAERLYGMAQQDVDAIKDLLRQSTSWDHAKELMLKSFEQGGERQKSKTGSHAVSFRSDQQLKPSWMDHVRSCVKRGIRISCIVDLLNEPGYDPNIVSVAQSTLKAWAKEASPSIKFKPGRPK